MSELTVIGKPNIIFNPPDDTAELRDPTAAAVRRPFSPLTPAQLDALRPQNKVTAPETPVMEAKRVAYQSGVTALEGVILRLQALERELAELKSKL